MATVTLLAEHNCVSSSIAGALDAFGIANLWWLYMGGAEPVFDLRLATLDGGAVTAAGGLPLHPKCSIHETGEADVVILPAFFPPFDLRTDRIQALCEWLRERHANGECLASTCTGTFFLAETGLLDGRRATTNWRFAGLFSRMYPKVRLQVDRILVEDGRLLSTGAASAFLNLCLHFIEKYGNAELADQCSRSLLIDPERVSQAPYMIHDFWKSHGDTSVLAAQRIMEEGYTARVSIDGLAREVGISQRHFKRRFKQATGDTPLAYLQRLRIENAKALLSTTRESVNEITWQVGYEDINSFRRLFRKHTGMSPKDYRNKFSRFARSA